MQFKNADVINITMKKKRRNDRMGRRISLFSWDAMVSVTLFNVSQLRIKYSAAAITHVNR